LYFAGGLAATFLQTAMTLLFGSASDAQIPALGASGAIAAVLGAYIVLYPKSNILTLVGWLPISLPAWLYLGGWFLLQFFAGNSALVAGTGGGGVAFFAHVGGFVFGALLTGLLVGTGRIAARRPQWDRT
jgi:membrane associated rhomboid family serine protease